MNINRNRIGELKQHVSCVMFGEDYESHVDNLIRFIMNVLIKRAPKRKILFGPSVEYMTIPNITSNRVIPVELYIEPNDILFIKFLTENNDVITRNFRFLHKSSIINIAILLINENLYNNQESYAISIDLENSYESLINKENKFTNIFRNFVKKRFLSTNQSFKDPYKMWFHRKESCKQSVFGFLREIFFTYYDIQFLIEDENKKLYQMSVGELTYKSLYDIYKYLKLV